MTIKMIDLPSDAKDSNVLAQRRPDEASERPIRAGAIATGGAGGGPRGAARPLALYYLLRTPSRLKGVEKGER
jgi:hypothetical protein